MRSFAPWILLALILLRPAGARGQVLTNAEAAAEATDRLLEQVLRILPEEAPRSLALRAEGRSGFAEEFESTLTPRLHYRGWSVWVLEEGQAPPEGALVLDYQVLQADLRYTAERRGFLSLGAPRIEREVVLELAGRLRDPVDGRLWWSGSPLVRYEDDFPGSLKTVVERDRPAWLRSSPAVPKDEAGKAGFWEKSLVVGLIGGVVALYVGGAR